jgi:multidrug efflux pump
MNLTELCLRKPVAAWMMLMAVVVVGLLAVRNIGVSLFPDVDRPTLSISTSLTGAAPEVIERDVVDPIETRLAQAEGVRSITADCRRGSARITVELELSRNVDDALQDVQNRIAGIRGLPRDLEPIQVTKSNPEDDDLLWIAVRGAASPQILSDRARSVADRLQTLPGVGEVRINGAPTRNLRIWLDIDRLSASGLTAAEVIAAVRRNHVELPAGIITSGQRELKVRVFGEAADSAAFRELVVANWGGRAVRLDDVALVEDGFEDTKRSFRVNGEPCVNIGVRKQRGANAVDVAAAVRARMADLAPDLASAGLSLDLVFDNSTIITESVHEMWRELITAVVLTALVCWLFLGSLTAAGNVLLAIPMSLLGTIAILQWLGLTLNTFTMLGLALAIGLVVDDAIMVQENIHRHREPLKPGDRLGAIDAARRGTQEIRGAALAATAAVIAIFSPVLFLHGEIGRFFLQFGLALSLAVALSYVEAVTLAPARLAYMPITSERSSRLGRWVDAGFEALARLYGAVLDHVLRRPWITVGVTIIVCAAGWATVRSLPLELIPPQDSGRLQMRIGTPSGTDFEQTDAVFRQAEALVAARPEVATYAAVVFSSTTGIIRMNLVPAGQRRGSMEIGQEIRKATVALPGVSFANVEDGAPQVIQASGPGGGARKPVEVVFRGGSWDELATAASAFRTRLESDGGRFRNVWTDYRPGQPELRILPDRDRAADLGVSMQDIADTVNSLVGSALVGTADLGGRRQDIRVRLRADQRQRPEDLGRIQLKARNGGLVPLSAVVRLDERPAPQSISRRDRERAITVRADNGPGLDEANAQAAAMAHAVAMRTEGVLPPAVRAVPGSGAGALTDTVGGMWFAVILGIAASYMVLAAQYNALIHPLIILTVLPMAVAGGFAALWLSNGTLNAFSMIGLLLLMGLAKKNSILLVDFARQQQLDDPSTGALAAMRAAGVIRLRPILMTSVATMMAALPIAFGSGPGTETRAPMAIAVLGGVALSTALSLVAVPALYLLVSRRRAPAG